MSDKSFRETAEDMHDALVNLGNTIVDALHVVELVEALTRFLNVIERRFR